LRGSSVGQSAASQSHSAQGQGQGQGHGQSVAPSTRTHSVPTHSTTHHHGDESLVRNLSHDLMHESTVGTHHQTTNTQDEAALVAPESVESQQSDEGTEDFDTSMLSEQYAARFVGSVFAQNSGHLSVHNLLRISSVGSDWEIETEDREGEREGEREQGDGQGGR
jgi:hypothetical protein